MPRIRTIKPEFPQSESMGKVSREARLFFIMLWTLADDDGRGRGAAPMLASLLFPYDDDAAGLIDGWIEELESQECAQFYQVEGSRYFQIKNWTSHQKIDKPTHSKFPAPTGEVEIRVSEREIETKLFESIKASGEIFGEKLMDLQRQVRVGSCYLDIVATGEKNRFVIEVKRDRLTQADLKQVLKYSEMTGCHPVLAGRGFGAQFPMEECRNLGVAVLSVVESSATLSLASEHVNSCSITFASVIERSVTVVVGPKDQGPGPRTKDQGLEEIDGQVHEIASLYPKVLDAFHLTREVAQVIAEAVARDGRDVVWVGTKSAGEAMKSWPPQEKQFIPSAPRFFRESQYRKSPEEWIRNGNGKQRQTSAVEQRVSGNREVLIEALRTHVAKRTGSDGDKLEDGHGASSERGVSARAV